MEIDKTQAPWLAPERYFGFAEIEQITNGEVKAEVARNWAHRGYLIIPGVSFVYNEAGNPSRLSQLQVYQAAYFSLATRAGMSLKEAEISFLARLERSAFAYHIEQQIRNRQWHAEQAAEARSSGKEDFADWAQSLSDRPVDDVNTPPTERYDDTRPFYWVINRYCFDRMFPEVEHPATDWFWIVPRDMDGTFRPMETQAVPASRRDVWVQDILDRGRQAPPLEIDISAIVRSVNEGIERLRASK